MSNDPFAPAVALYVEDTLLREDITRDLVEVKCDMALDLVTKIEVVVRNPRHRYTDSKIFAEGNEFEAHFGYGTRPEFIARGELVRFLPYYPGNEVPILRLIAYDRSWRLGRQATQITGGKTPEKSKEEPGTLWTGTVGEVVTRILKKYGIVADVEPEVANEGEKFTQRKGESDISIVKALANLHGCEFIVEYDVSSRKLSPDGVILSPGKWIGRMYRVIPPQPKYYTFTYNEDAGASTIQQIELEWGLPDAVSEVQASVWDHKTRSWIVIMEQKTKPGKTPAFKSGKSTDPKAPPGGPAPALGSMTMVKIAASGHSVDVVTRPFDSQAQAAAWVKNWLNRYRDSFILAKGTLPGIETLRPGQTHYLEGLGDRYSGEYYFTSCVHRYTRGGYLTEFGARKVIK